MSTWFSARHRGLRRSVHVGLGAVLVLALAACGSSGSADQPAKSSIDPNLGGDAAWQQIVDAANAEGKVVFYSANDEDSATVPPAFHAAYPKIQVEVQHFASGALTAKLDAEAGNTATGADVASHSSRVWWQANAARLTPAKGPAIARYWKDTGFVYANGAYTLVGGNPLGAAVNTDRLAALGATPIKTYKDLLQPALRGNVGVVPGEGSPAAEQWWYYAGQEMGGASGLQQLAALQPRLYRSGTTPLATDVASGEIAVGFYATRSSVTALADKGAPVAFVPLDPVISIGGYTGIVGNAHPNAAQVLENWLLSPAGQVALAGDGNALTPLDVSVLGAESGNARQIPKGSHVTDGVLLPEQTSFYQNVFLPTVVGRS
ncbi:extracellular solute-binding protein [Amycolatopsis sp. GM8]|uniref:extracellular solute-binding protein n=1 Tax=Amycolatopsis sp. GM8 TaxID=2896530 RepID=UPI001F1B8BDA|nr:extracellular solute-binding protein [Amycolatopsis sp. GM8]